MLKDVCGKVVALLNLAITSEAIGDLHKSTEWYSLVSVVIHKSVM